MSRVIQCSLSTESIAQAISELKAYKQTLKAKEKQLMEGLAKIGVQEASIRFSSAMYDGINDSTVSLSPTANGYEIVAEGESVAFIEFGTGVTHNTGEPSPLPRPEGIVGIGEYGDGKGKRKAWGYRGDPGSSGEVKSNGIVITRGNPAAMPMWYATEEMRSKILQVAKEVFG